MNILHAYSLSGGARHEFARTTWPEPSPEFKDCFTSDAMVKGSWWESRLIVDDERTVPAIQRVIGVAADQAEAEADVILLTNDDICFGDNLLPLIAGLNGRNAYTHRREFKVVDRKLSVAEIQTGARALGVDTFIFTAGWWIDNAHDMPLMFVGREGWDLIMLKLMKQSNALRLGACTYHERHDSYWYQPGVLENNKGNVWNRARAVEWLKGRGYIDLRMQDESSFEEDPI